MNIQHHKMVCFSLLCGLLLGCGSTRQDESQRTTEQKLSTLTTAYAKYMSQHRGETPANEAALRAFLLERKDILSRFDTDILTVFTSDRDHQPFKIYYAMPANFDGLAMHEQTSTNQERLVGYTIGAVAKLSEEEFIKLKLPSK